MDRGKQPASIAAALHGAPQLLPDRLRIGIIKSYRNGSAAIPQRSPSSSALVCPRRQGSLCVDSSVAEGKTGMIPSLHITLLGGFDLRYGADPVTSVNTARLQSLLAYCYCTMMRRKHVGNWPLISGPTRPSRRPAPTCGNWSTICGEPCPPQNTFSGLMRKPSSGNPIAPGPLM